MTERRELFPGAGEKVRAVLERRIFEARLAGERGEPPPQPGPDKLIVAFDDKTVIDFLDPKLIDEIAACFSIPELPES